MSKLNPELVDHELPERTTRFSPARVPPAR